MSYFLSENILQFGQTGVLSGPEARHILLSRRIKPGEQFLVQDNSNKRYVVELTGSSKNRIEFKVLKQVPIPSELPVNITIFLSVIAEQAFDFVLQKSTELGAASIVLFNSERTATKLTINRFSKKQDRWHKILWEAAKQSGRGQTPELKFLPGLDEVVTAAKNFDLMFICDASGARLHMENPMTRVPLVIGPEGGFTTQELEVLKSTANSQTISLSPFILRAETAVITALAAVQNSIYN